MINLSTLFRNHFGAKCISDDKLKVFSEDHIQRLTANNEGGLFTTLITETTTAHNQYFGQISSEATGKALQKSQTKVVDDIMDSFKDEISRREGLIKSMFGKDSSTYIEFFPNGISEYRNARKANIETLIVRMATVAANHSAQVGEEFVKVFTDFQTSYTEARNSQMNQKGTVSAIKSNAKSTRSTLELQLVKNLHFIAYTFPGDEDRCGTFFDQSIVQIKQSSASDGLGRLSGLVTNSETKEAIPNVGVEIVDAGIPVCYTSTDGKFRSRNVDVGNYEVRVDKSGFRPVTMSVEVMDDGDTLKNIELIPN
ncbi:MAG: carboxypeptidase-like regulatory domain-containing protein [Bacteroidales bacterium]